MDSPEKVTTGLHGAKAETEGWGNRQPGFASSPNSLRQIPFRLKYLGWLLLPRMDADLLMQ